MNVDNFIYHASRFMHNHQELLITTGVIFIALIVIILLLRSSDNSEPIVETQPEVVPETVKEKVPIEEKVSVLPEAKEWWKTLDIGHKRLYAYDAQFKDKRISHLKNADIVLIYETYMENKEITTK